MESLYRKYRPQTFADVVGQQHVVSTLENAVLEGRTSHAYLFCGPRGTGKTTMARILAKALMCEQAPGHLPDGTCEQCRLIATGEHPDVYELDAASRTGVDNVREEIINRVSFAPVRGNYKFYIIDEVHMLTTAAFNALLKTLEEPPEHVVFVLCTTDPQKIPETILSRVQRFDFRAIGNADIESHLEEICNKEGFTFDKAALDLVVRHARGGMRDALSTLEKLSVFGDGAISMDSAQDLLGEVSGSMLVSVACAIAERNVASLFEAVGELASSGRDLLQFTRELAGHLRDVYVISAVGAKPGVVDVSDEELQNLRDEALAFGSVDRISRALAVLGDAGNEMRTATNQRLVLEIALTRLARPKSDLTLDSLADRVSRLERRLAELVASGVAAPSVVPAPNPAPTPVSPPAHAPAPEPSTSPAPMPAPVSGRAPEPAPAPAPAPGPAPAPIPASAPAVAPTPAPRQAPTSTPAPTTKPEGEPAVTPPSSLPAVTDGGELQRKWKQVVDGLMHSDPARGALIRNTTAVSDDGAGILVNLPKGAVFSARMLERADVRAIVDPAVSAVFGRRSLTFVEASLQGAEIARKQREQSAPTPASATASAPAPAMVPATPPAPSPVPASAPTPASPQAQAGSSRPAEEMPWDDAPPYEEVPYDDADFAPYDEDSLTDVPHASEPATASPAAPVPAPDSDPAPSPRPAAAPVPDSDPAPSPRPAAAPAEESAASAKVPAEAEGILKMLSDVFGGEVTLNVERKG